MSKFEDFAQYVRDHKDVVEYAGLITIIEQSFTDEELVEFAIDCMLNNHKDLEDETRNKFESLTDKTVESIRESFSKQELILTAMQTMCNIDY